MWNRRKRAQAQKYMLNGNREKALKRDKFRCRHCGIAQEKHYRETGRGLCVHHLDESGAYTIAPNHALANLSTLCTACHVAEHKRIRKLHLAAERKAELEFLRLELSPDKFAEYMELKRRHTQHTETPRPESYRRYV